MVWGSGAVHLSGDSRRGPMSWTFRLDWSELIFITWALLRHTRQPQLLDVGWLPPGWQWSSRRAHPVQLTSPVLSDRRRSARTQADGSARGLTSCTGSRSWEAARACREGGAASEDAEQEVTATDVQVNITADVRPARGRPGMGRPAIATPTWRPDDVGRRRRRPQEAPVAHTTPLALSTPAALVGIGIGLGVPTLVLAVRGRRGGRGPAIAGLITSTLAIVVPVAVTLVVFVVAPAGAAARPSEQDDVAARAEPLAVGTRTTVGDHTVAVTGVDQDADDVIAAADPLNEAPAGQYMLIDLNVTDDGAEEGDAWLDSAIDHLGTEARDDSDDSCGAVVPDATFEQPAL